MGRGDQVRGDIGAIRSAQRALELNIGASSTDAAVLGDGEGFRLRAGSGLRRTAAGASRWGRQHLSWFSVVGAAAGLVLVLEYVRPVPAEASTLRATVQTVITMLAFTAAWLARARFSDSRRLSDLSLAVALLTLGLFSLSTDAVPAALDLNAGSYLAAASVLGQLSVAAMFMATALVSRDKLVLGVAGAERAAVGVGLGIVAVVDLGALALRDHVGDLRDPLTPVLVLSTAALFAYAATVFFREDRTVRSGVISAVGGAVVLLAAARLSYVADAFPPDRSALADGFQVIALGLIVATLVRQEIRVRTLKTRAAAIAERRRVARDLHDGLAQDLAFIAAHGERIARSLGAEHPVVIAAKHALLISRDVIADLSDAAATTPVEALEALAAELGDHFGIMVTIDVQLVGGLAHGAQDHLLRIAREAIVNAARHGDARTVVVSLTDQRGVVILRVSDDGSCPSAGSGLAPEGFGLRSMRERATVLGGDLTIRRRAGTGTVVEVVFQ